MIDPLIFGLGPMELLIILAVVLLLFGGSRLAGLGRSGGRAIREFKEETKGLSNKDAAEKQAQVGEVTHLTEGGATRHDIADAEVVEPKSKPEDLR